MSNREAESSLEEEGKEKKGRKRKGEGGSQCRRKEEAKLLRFCEQEKETGAAPGG